jgi:hypothetical protein
MCQEYVQQTHETTKPEHLPAENYENHRLDQHRAYWSYNLKQTLIKQIAAVAKIRGFQKGGAIGDFRLPLCCT